MYTTCLTPLTTKLPRLNGSKVLLLDSEDVSGFETPLTHLSTIRGKIMFLRSRACPVRRLTNLPPSVSQLSRQCESLNILQRHGPPWPDNRDSFTLLWIRMDSNSGHLMISDKACSTNQMTVWCRVLSQSAGARPGVSTCRVSRAGCLALRTTAYWWHIAECHLL
jgi:hypothetical protein